MATPRIARVRVPCSTSNLGPGFDTLGLALDRYLDARFEPGGTILTLTRSGTVEALMESVDDDLLARTFKRAMESAGAPTGGSLFVESEIPLARGLGSSAAAIVAGYDLARATLGLPPDPDRAFRTAYEHEGHGDNAAPSLLGGLCAVLPGSDGPRMLPLTLSSNVGFAYAAPAAGISTAAARSALPDKVPHAIAVQELGRLTALLRGLADGDPDLIRIGIEDQLHVPHRLPLIPGAFNALSAGYDAGAWGVTISGSGSGLLALCEPSRAQVVADAMHEVLAVGAAGSGSVAMALEPDLRGLVREDTSE